MDLNNKRPKIERGRSIEGAIQVTKTNALKKKEEQKVTPSDLLEWQNNWKKIMKRDSKIYFDTADELDTSRSMKTKMDKKQELLKCGFSMLSAQITSFFDASSTIVITRRNTDNIHLLPETDILRRAKRNYMKVWNYEKATRFLKNLDVDIDKIDMSKTALATRTLSNLLQNEKKYGPSDRDPRTRRDDVHYFKNPHVYLYDSWQTWAPIIALEWKRHELNKDDNLPYPTLKIGTFGRCPFIGDRSCDESSYKRAIKRFSRDKTNKPYALELRRMYQHHCEPSIENVDLIFIPHTCMDSKKLVDSWLQRIKREPQVKAVETNDLPTTKQLMWGEKVPAPPKLKNNLQVLPGQETEEFPDDLCTIKRQPRIPYEIKASGVNQSNDAATSFGNGLGPTKATVTSKNIRTLNRLVIDRKLEVNRIPLLVNKKSSNDVKSETKIISHGPTKDVPSKMKTNVKDGVPGKEPPPAQEKVVNNSGYCENCRVKYESLEDHIVSEKHMEFADDDLNFESIDYLIEKLQFQF